MFLEVLKWIAAWALFFAFLFVAMHFQPVL